MRLSYGVDYQRRREEKRSLKCWFDTLEMRRKLAKNALFTLISVEGCVVRGQQF
jgi:hypothetical protein